MTSPSSPVLNLAAGRADSSPSAPPMTAATIAPKIDQNVAHVALSTPGAIAPAILRDVGDPSETEDV